LNLKSKKVFNDPFFLLQQNDVVLLEPLRASRIKENASWIASYASLTTSIVTLVITLISTAKP
ncbi:MAG: polysaccharide export protein, partial [Bacteroidales bacterium]|nr:polysaccharide export protein [Bacteroidales bacterium]